MRGAVGAGARGVSGCAGFAPHALTSSRPYRHAKLAASMLFQTCSAMKKRPPSSVPPFPPCLHRGLVRRGAGCHGQPPGRRTRCRDVPHRGRGGPHRRGAPDRADAPSGDAAAARHGVRVRRRGCTACGCATPSAAVGRLHRRRGKILNIERMAPRTEDNHCAVAPARFALEMKCRLV